MGSISKYVIIFLTSSLELILPAFIKHEETWSVNSKPVKFLPDLGKYSSDDASVVEVHVVRYYVLFINFGSGSYLSLSHTHSFISFLL